MLTPKIKILLIFHDSSFISEHLLISQDQIDFVLP